MELFLEATTHNAAAFTFAHTDMDDNTKRAMGRVMVLNPGLVQLTLHDLNLHQGVISSIGRLAFCAQGLKELSFSKIHIGDRGVAKLSRILLSNAFTGDKHAQLFVLMLNDCGITNVGVFIIAKAAKFGRTLWRLEILRNLVDEVGYKALFATFQKRRFITAIASDLTERERSFNAWKLYKKA